jgi:hypothetical protein
LSTEPPALFQIRRVKEIARGREKTGRITQAELRPLIIAYWFCALVLNSKKVAGV